MIKRTLLFLCTFIAVNLAAAAFAQPAAPTNLQATRLNPNTIQLTWTPPPGVNNRFLIERGGPGLTFYTQIGGPISESTFVVDLKATGADPNERYYYRVRAMDAALNRGPYSVAVTPFVSEVRNLALVGNNVLDLIAMLPGYQQAAGQLSKCPAVQPSNDSLSCRLLPLAADPIVFMLSGTSGRNVSFQDAEGTFSRDCASCEFAVPTTQNDPKLTFKLSEDGLQLLVTCRAPTCEVLNARTMDVANGIFSASDDVARRRLTSDESIRIPSSQRTLFSIFAK